MKLESVFWKSFRAIQFVAFLLVSIILIAGCSNRRSQPSQVKETVDTIHGITYEEAKIPADSSIIYILSQDGEVVRKINYLTENYDENGQSKEPEYANYIKSYPENDTISGDFNGDKVPEKAWFEDRGVAVIDDCRTTGNKKSCESVIRFSNLTIKPLTIDFCPMWIFKNEGDLNSDGKDEIGVLPGWFSSGCRNYEVFTYNGDRWTEACSPIGNTYNMREAGIVMIEKDSRTPGSAIIRESVDSYISTNPQNTIPVKYIQGSSCTLSNVVEYKIKLN